MSYFRSWYCIVVTAVDVVTVEVGVIVVIVVAAT
ncbi:hypothetical protein A2U01_0057441, partial [Trifolium medium]|nr:hypothetical protein [Trifolium medium]